MAGRELVWSGEGQRGWLNQEPRESRSPVDV